VLSFATAPDGTRFRLKMLVNGVQILAEQMHHLHATGLVLAQELQKLMPLDEADDAILIATALNL